MNSPFTIAAKWSLEEAFKARANAAPVLFLSEECERFLRTVFSFNLESSESAYVSTAQGREIQRVELVKAIDQGLANMLAAVTNDAERSRMLEAFWTCVHLHVQKENW